MTFSKRLVWTSVSAILLILSAQLAGADDAKDKEKAAKERAEIDSNAAMIIKEFQGMKGRHRCLQQGCGLRGVQGHEGRLRRVGRGRRRSRRRQEDRRAYLHAHGLRGASASRSE